MSKSKHDTKQIAAKNVYFRFINTTISLRFLLDTVWCISVIKLVKSGKPGALKLINDTQI